MEPIQVVRLLETPTKLNAEQSGIRDTYYGSLTLGNGSEQAAYIKHIHQNEIFTEVICSMICSSIGIPTPVPYLVLLDGKATIGNSTLDDNPALFATADAQRPSFKLNEENNEVLLEWLRNWQYTPKSAVFDEQIANQDRNQGNILIASAGDVCLIDHGAAFDTRVLSNCCQARNSFADLLQHNKKPLDRISKALPSLATVNFDDIIKCSRWELYADEDHVKRVSAFYKERLNSIRDIFDFRYCKTSNLSLPI